MEKYSPYGKYNPFDQHYHQTRPMISYNDMLSEKKLLKEVYELFTNALNRKLKQQGGIVTNNQIEVFIQRSYLKSKQLKTEKQKNVCEGFFDTYLGFWRNPSREFANAWAEKIFK